MKSRDLFWIILIAASISIGDFFFKVGVLVCLMAIYQIITKEGK